MWDRTATALALFFYSMPVFVLGLLLLYVFYYQFTIHGMHLFPGQGYTYFTDNPVKWFQGLVLPWITLALVSAAVYTRLTRGSMLDVLGEDYIRTARSKGLDRAAGDLPPRAALGPDPGREPVRHRRRHPASAGPSSPRRSSACPGSATPQSTPSSKQDLPVIIGIVIIATAGVVVANIMVDILYAVLDPRVRLH